MIAFDKSAKSVQVFSLVFIASVFLFSLFSLYLIFALQSSQSSLIGTGTIVEDASRAINFTLNNTEPIPQNITNFTIFLDGAFNFSTLDNASAVTAGVTGFPRVSSATVVNTYVISWENTTDGLVNASSGGNRTFGMNVTVTQPGQYTITTNANLSNGSIVIGGVTLIVTDTTVPVINLSYPSTNHTNFTGAAENITAQSTDNYNVSVTGVYSALKNYTGYYNLNGVLAGNTSTNWTNLDQSGTSNFFNNTLNASAFTDGVYTLVANSTDNASNMVGTTLNITIDNTLPVIAYASDTTSGGINATSNSITVNVTYNESNFGFANMTFYLYSPGATVNVSRTFTNTTNSTNFSGLADGVYLFSVVMLDAAGNAGNTTNQSVTIDNTAPVINVTHPASAVNFTRTADNITVRATDNINSIYGALSNNTHYFNLNGVLAGNASSNWTSLNASGSSNFYNATLNASGPNLADGTYTLVVNATDAVANLSNTSAARITIDNTDPAVAYADGTPANNAALSVPSFVVTAAWNETNYANMTFYAYYSNGTLNTSRTHTNNTNHTNFSGLAEDVDFIFGFAITDSSGNKVFLSNRTVTLDAVSNSGSDSGSGGGSSSVTYDVGEITAAIDEALVAGDKVKFMYRNLTHTLSLAGYSSSQVVVQILSNVTIVTIPINQTRNADIDKDGKDDFAITYTKYSVSSGYGKVTLKIVPLTVSSSSTASTTASNQTATTAEENTTTTDTNSSQEQPAAETTEVKKSSSSMTGLWFGIVGLIAIAVVIFVLLQRNRAGKPAESSFMPKAKKKK